MELHVALLIGVVATCGIVIATDMWLSTRARRRYENELLRDRARDNAPVSEVWVEDLAYTPWSGTVSLWRCTREYEWTDVDGRLHSECDTWTRQY